MANSIQFFPARSTLKSAIDAQVIVPVIIQNLLIGYAATFNLERAPYALLDLWRNISAGTDFEGELIQKRVGKIQVITDGRNTMTASVASGYVGRIVDELTAAARERKQGTFDQFLVTPIVIGMFQAVRVFLACRFFSRYRSQERGRRFF